MANPKLQDNNPITVPDTYDFYVPRAGDYVVEIRGVFGGGTLIITAPGDGTDGNSYDDHDAVTANQTKVLTMAAGINRVQLSGGTSPNLYVNISRCTS